MTQLTLWLSCDLLNWIVSLWKQGIYLIYLYRRYCSWHRLDLNWQNVSSEHLVEVCFRVAEQLFSLSGTSKMSIPSVNQFSVYSWIDIFDLENLLIFLLVPFVLAMRVITFFIFPHRLERKYKTAFSGIIRGSFASISHESDYSMDSIVDKNERRAS